VSPSGPPPSHDAWFEWVRPLPPTTDNSADAHSQVIAQYKAAGVLRIICYNIIDYPTEERYRRIRIDPLPAALWSLCAAAATGATPVTPSAAAKATLPTSGGTAVRAETAAAESAADAAESIKPAMLENPCADEARRSKVVAILSRLGFVRSGASAFLSLPPSASLSNIQECAAAASRREEALRNRLAVSHEKAMALATAAVHQDIEDAARKRSIEYAEALRRNDELRQRGVPLDPVADWTRRAILTALDWSRHRAPVTPPSDAAAHSGTTPPTDIMTDEEIPLALAATVSSRLARSISHAAEVIGAAQPNARLSIALHRALLNEPTIVQILNALGREKPEAAAGGGTLPPAPPVLLMDAAEVAVPIHIGRYGVAPEVLAELHSAADAMVHASQRFGDAFATAHELVKDRLKARDAQRQAAADKAAAEQRPAGRAREEELVATQLINDIAAYMELEWHLKGGNGFQAEHRREAKRLLEEYRKGTLGMPELHRLANAAEESYIAAKKDAGITWPSGRVGDE
jgi:hypothetical protein